MVRSKLRIVLTIATVAVGAIAASGASAQRLVGSSPVVTSSGALSVHAVALVKGYSTGDPGSASDETCAGLAKDVNDAVDHSYSEFQMGDQAAGVKWHGTATAIQDFGLDQGCFFIDPID